MTPADGNGLATPDAGAGPDLVPTGEDGLTVAEVEARLARYGKNVLEEKRTSKLMVLVRLVRRGGGVGYGWAWAGSSQSSQA